MQKFSQWIGGAAALAVLTMAATTAVRAQDAAAPQKAVKDQAEYDLFDAVKKDLLQGNGAKAITDLDAWKQHNPDSAYKDDREVMYLKAYELSKDYDKELAKAKELMSHDLDAMFSDPAQGPSKWWPSTSRLSRRRPRCPIRRPSNWLSALRPRTRFWITSGIPRAIDPAAWATAKQQIAAASNALLYKAAFLPPYQAEQKKDYDTAVAGYQKAMADYPNKTALAYRLGITLRAQHKDDLAIWQFARVVGMDPTLDGTAKAADITKFLNTYYHNLHGSDEGLDQLIQQAKASATPPADFHVKTAQEIATENEAKFEKDHPDIALWMKLKATLTSDQGQQYFDSGMKGAQVPELTGTVLESACRAKELKVAVPLPDATGAPVAEITLKLVNDAGAASPPYWQGGIGSCHVRRRCRGIHKGSLHVDDDHR